MINNVSANEFEQVLDKYKHDIQTEIETKDGTLILFHSKPITNKTKKVFKDFTTEEIKLFVQKEMGFNAYKQE